MRILFVSDYPHLPDIHGGLQTTTHDLCLAIQTMGAEAAVLCGQLGANANDTQLKKDEQLGYTVIRVQHPGLSLAEVAAGWCADIIVVQTGTCWGSGKSNYVLDKLYFRTNKCVTK